ncbi:SWIM zinc finger family protein [Actinophytocola sp.]|uniref:SWIM zinc finger family protein n=1 Tax=Actinophytocola sp. TaxID=1872138 RepID=UPI002EDABA87
MSERASGPPAPGDEPAVGFPAFPASSRRPGRFARTWWGQAWLQAMEDTSLDQEPLKRGRRYAYAGRVGPITASPGRIAAQVYGEDESVYHTAVFVERLSGEEWRRFLDEVAAKAGHLAALLDRDMPHDLVTAAADADVRLLPGIGDLQPECDCPGWELPCRHAAALCFQASWLLDADPFVLLLLRGLGRRELTDELRGRSRATTPAPAVSTPEARPVRPLPPPLPPPPDEPAPPLEVPPAPGVNAETLAAAAALASQRARDLLLRDGSGAESKVTAVLGRLLRE